jgi:glycosyltransferase involved in cell wall biosynthesis
LSTPEEITPGEQTKINQRVLVVAYVCSPKLGSEAGNAWNWVSHFAELGCEVDLLTTKRFVHDLEPAIKASSGLIKLHAIEAPTTRGLPSQVAVYAGYLRWQTAALRYARTTDLLNQAQVIHHITWSSLFWGSRFHSERPPLIFGPIGGGQIADFRLGTPMSRGARLKEKSRSAGIRFIRLNLLAVRTARKASLILATNYETLQVVTQLGARSAQLMLDSAPPPAVMSTQPVEADQHHHGRVIWIGRMVPIKDPVLAVEAFAELAQRMPEATLDMFGSGSELARVERRVTELGLRDCVQLHGHVDWATLPGHLDRSRVLLISSLRESASSQMLEALGRGVPIVGINQHGVAAFLPTDCGHLVEVGERAAVTADLAAGLAGILALSDSEWSKVSSRARAAAEHMAWPEKAAELLVTFKKLTERAVR